MTFRGKHFGTDAARVWLRFEVLNFVSEQGAFVFGDKRAPLTRERGHDVDCFHVHVNG